MRVDPQRDRDRAVADLGERLPPSLSPLARLAYNYVWSWLPGGATLFRDLDPALWRRSGCNPRWMIETVVPHRLRRLAGDAAYVDRVTRVAAALDAHLAAPTLAAGALSAERPVAYFCSEFGVHCSLPLYGGGLGVLAGDTLKAASDLGVPMLGVGLLYRQGYFHQRIDTSGWQIEYWTPTPFERLPMVLVTDGEERPLAVELPLRGRTVRVQVWRIDVGRVPLYLLDTDRDDNHPIDRWITARLYIGDRHTRLTQYAVLGIGGVRALDALGITPALHHLNEGHAGLSGIERLARHVARGARFDDALAAVRRESVFTTHTPVAAGNEWYRPDETAPVLGGWADTLPVPRRVLRDLSRSRPGDDEEPLNITPLALRTTRAAIGVSRRHGEVARGMWRDIWPDRPVEAVPIGHVTNGIHTTSMMAVAMQDLLDRHLPADWRARVDDPAVWSAVAGIPDAELWRVRCALRASLVEYARELSVPLRLARGESPDYVEAATRGFDPGVLTIGFARRVATYKRLALLLRRPGEALALLADQRRPIQLVIAGKAHPQDDEAKRTLQRVLELRGAPHVGSRVVLLEDYDLHMAPRIVAGVDLWVNLPRPPQEACGTSGMKVVANGGLNLSVLDGWWLEACDDAVGWGIASPDADPDTQDEHDARVLIELLRDRIIPAFYQRDGSGLPGDWISRMKASMQRLIPRFSAQRMLRDYVDTLYAPP